MSANTDQDQSQQTNGQPDPVWVTFKRVTLPLMLMIFAGCMVLYLMVTYAGKPAPSFQERQSQKIIQQNNQWRSNVCKDLGC